MTMDKKYDIFICYSRKDIEKVSPIINELEARDFKVWIDMSNIDYGDTFPDRIAEALDASDSLLFMCTTNSLCAPYCKNEIGYARTNGKMIRAILVDGQMPKQGWFALEYQNVNCINITKEEQKKKFFEDIEAIYQPEKAEERRRKIEEAKAIARRKVQEEERKKIEQAEIKARQEELERISQKTLAKRIGTATLSLLKNLSKGKIIFSLILIPAVIFILFRMCSWSNEETPQSNLHESIVQYKENVGIFVTKTWTIRIDMLNDSTLRYASWENPNAQDSKPALILYNGFRDENNHCYIFKNGGISYCIGTDNLGLDSVIIHNAQTHLKSEKIIERQ